MDRCSCKNRKSHPWRGRATGPVLVLALFTALAVPFFFPTDVAFAGPDAEANVFEAGAFENPDRCKRCHRDIYNAWASSKHRFAWEDPFYRPDYLKAGVETEGFTDVFCGECHAPIGRRTRQLPPRDGSLFDDTSRQGVSCDYCHTATKIVEPVNVHTISEPGKLKQGSKGDGRSPYHGIAHSNILTDSAFCGACHGVVHPATGAVIIDTYEDWKKSPYGAEGVRCQDCHMTPGPGVTKNPGKSSPMGKMRDHVATHFFPGGSVFFQDRSGNAEQADMARRMLQAAAELKTTAVRKGGLIDLRVEVHNVGAGHKIPTGVTYIREIWLEITVTDKAGKVIFQSGHETDGNRIDPQAVLYRVLFKDKDGKPTPKSWIAHGIAYDRRIPARGQDAQTFAIPAAPDNGPCKVLVRLLYRSMSQEAAEGFGMGALTVPSIEMARTETTAP